MDEATRALLAEGRERFERHELDDAERCLRKVVEVEPRFADVHNLLGLIQHDRGRLGEALAAFEAALRVNPLYTEAALNLAVTYNDLGRYEDARNVYEAVSERRGRLGGEPDAFVKGKIANLHAETSRAYADAGLLTEAMHELRKATLLCPTFPDLRVRLANLYRQQGDMEAARFELSEVVKARPNYLPARITLGVVLLGLGDKAGAVEQWSAAAGIDAENKTVQSYLRMAAQSE